MAKNISLPKPKLKLPELKKGKTPSKNFINIQLNRKRDVSPRKTIPVLILLILLLIVGGKFLVVDRIAGIMGESNNVSALKEELAETNRQISEMEDLEDTYAHYTISGMTDEELSRVDRVKAMRLVEKAFLRGNTARSWNLTGNVMTLQVTGSSLRGLNQLASELEAKPIVERCVISSANKNTLENGDVAVTFIIYLQQPEESE